MASIDRKLLEGELQFQCALAEEYRAGVASAIVNRQSTIAHELVELAIAAQREIKEIENELRTDS